MQSENGPLEAVLTLGTETIEEDVSSDGKNEWQGYLVHYTPIIAIQNQMVRNGKVLDQLKFKTRRRYRLHVPRIRCKKGRSPTDIQKLFFSVTGKRSPCGCGSVFCEIM